MSGIALVVSRDGHRASSSDVLAMLDAIPYRGPDGAFARDCGRAVLGHARMITTAGERAERQPLTSPRTGCTIVADIRLDNRAEVRAKLADPPAPGASDARLVLSAYEQWGVDAPRHLRGDFAMAIWDPREQRLVCARDSAGQRTLYFREDARTFAAASEIHQLLLDPSVPIEPNDERIRMALAPSSMNQNAKEQEATYYTGIRSLLPGHVLVLKGQRLDVRRFSQLVPQSPIRYRRNEDYVAHFRELFFDAVGDRLESEGSIGALLSGGLDSSSMVCVAQELYRSGQVKNGGFATFSNVYDGLDCDERPYIEEVQTRYGFEAHFLAPDRTREWLPLMPSGFRARPEIPTTGLLTMFDAAHAAGTRVLLTGEVADSWLRGSPLVFESLLRNGQLGSMARYVSMYRALSGDSLLKTLTLYLVAPLLPRMLQKVVMRSYLMRKLELERWRLLPRWMPEPLRQALFETTQHQLLAAEDGRQFANETQHRLVRSLDPPESPTIASGWPIEIWRPFADRRLHEFVLAIPPEHLFEPAGNGLSTYGASKQLLRRSLVGVLPDSIRLRSVPTTFDSVVEQNIVRQWPLLEAVFGPGGRPKIAERGYVDAPGFWDRLKQFRSGRFGSDAICVYYLIGLETWLRNLDGPRAQVTTVSTRFHSRPAVIVEDRVESVLSRHSRLNRDAHPTLERR
jgi:asparagine synthase (glutamine-hydrolysing)